MAALHPNLGLVGNENQDLPAGFDSVTSYFDNFLARNLKAHAGGSKYKISSLSSPTSAFTFGIQANDIVYQINPGSKPNANLGVNNRHPLVVSTIIGVDEELKRNKKNKIPLAGWPDNEYEYNWSVMSKLRVLGVALVPRNPDGEQFIATTSFAVQVAGAITLPAYDTLYPGQFVRYAIPDQAQRENIAIYSPSTDPRTLGLVVVPITEKDIGDFFSSYMGKNMVVEGQEDLQDKIIQMLLGSWQMIMGIVAISLNNQAVSDAIRGGGTIGGALYLNEAGKNDVLTNDDRWQRLNNIGAFSGANNHTVVENMLKSIKENAEFRTTLRNYFIRQMGLANGPSPVYSAFAAQLGQMVDCYLNTLCGKVVFGATKGQSAKIVLMP